LDVLPREVRARYKAEDDGDFSDYTDTCVQMFEAAKLLHLDECAA
jgi:hypothetical protein